MTDRKLCPKCGNPMIKAGHARSGKNWKQVYLCASVKGCGYKTLGEFVKQVDGKWIIDEENK